MYRSSRMFLTQRLCGGWIELYTFIHIYVFVLIMNFTLVCDPNSTLQILSTIIEHTAYNKDMLRSFQKCLRHPGQDSTYLSLMLCYQFPAILDKTLQTTDEKWKRFLINSSKRLTEQHLNFVLNKDEFLKACFREFVIT